MHRSTQLFSLILLANLVFSYSVIGQTSTYKKLDGRWIAYYPAPYGFSTLATDGTSKHYNNDVIPDSVILEFRPDKHGSIRWPNSAKAQFFSYRLVNSKLIEMQYADKKPWRHTLSISGNKLSLGEYPVPKEPQESIAILYTLTFVKQL